MLLQALNHLGPRWALLAVLSGGCLWPVDASAAPVVYVDPDAPACGGMSPCFADFASAISDVDDFGEIVVLDNVSSSIGAASGKQGITVRGSVSSVTINGSINMITDSVNGWTFKDLEVTLNCTVKNVVTSLRAENLVCPNFKIGRLDQDTTATIEIINVDLPTETGVMNILADRGFDLDGVILIEECEMWALNIHTYVMPATTANLLADITVRNSVIDHAANVLVNSDGLDGQGNISGEILFENNVMAPEDGALGVSIAGGASGDITGHVRYLNNNGSGLSVQTRASNLGGSVGQVTMIGNTVQGVEIQARLAALLGPVLFQDNTVIFRGGVLPTGGPYVQINGDPVPGRVDVLGTLGSEAQLAIKSQNLGPYSGELVVSNNDVARIVIDSQAGDLSGSVMVSGNVLPVLDSPDGSLTLRTLSGGNVVDTLIEDNQLDVISVDLDGGVTGDLSIVGNVVRETGALLSRSNSGAGVARVVGNDFWDRLSTDGVVTDASFNRIGVRLTSPTGNLVSAEDNWWTCSTGPGMGCASASPGVDFEPWLELSASLCPGATVSGVEVNLLTNSDGFVPANNRTPGSVFVSADVGTVAESPLSLLGGVGMTTVEHASGASPTVTASLDLSQVVAVADCSDLIFRDGVETGDARFWMAHNASSF